MLAAGRDLITVPTDTDAFSGLWPGHLAEGYGREAVSAYHATKPAISGVKRLLNDGAAGETVLKVAHAQGAAGYGRTTGGGVCTGGSM